MKKIQLSIPAPCREDWSAMTPSEKGRFCASCNKTVVDFTTMSDRQLAAFFRQRQVHTCGRFHRDQLDRPIEIPKKPLPWIRYFFGMALPAFLISLKTGAQHRYSTHDQIVSLHSITDKNDFLKTKTADTTTIKGKVQNLVGIGIPYASVVWKGTSSGVVCDENGTFIIDRISQNDSVLVVSATFYVHTEYKVQSGDAVITLEGALTGEVVVVAGYVISKPVEPAQPIHHIMDKAFKHFSVFPNPVTSRSQLKLDLRKLEEGNYTVSVIDMNGVVVQTDEASIERKRTTVTMALGSVTPGSYLIHVFNRKTAASYTEKILVK